MFESLYYRLLSHYKSTLKRYHNTHIIKEIKGKLVKLIDSSTISLCLAMFNWAYFRTAKGGIKLHTSWDYNLMIPDVVNITEAKATSSLNFFLAYPFVPGQQYSETTFLGDTATKVSVPAGTFECIQTKSEVANPEGTIMSMNWCKGVGLIKYQISPNQTWELINYHHN